MKKIIIYILSAVLILILFVAYSLSNLSVMNIIPRASLPERYKGYRDIRDGVTSTYYQSQLLFSSDNETRLGDYPPLLNTQNHTVIIAKQTDKKKGDHSDLSTIYLKLNANGTVIDSLIFTRNWPIEWGGFLITPHGYCGWMLDGDKEMHPYAEQNTALTEDSASLAQHFKQLYQTSTLVHYYSHYDVDDPRLDSLEVDKVLFFQHGQWVALLGKKLSDYEAWGYKIKAKSSINPMLNRADDQHLYQRNAYIYMDHFQKEHYWKSHGPSLGSETGYSRPDQWEGSAYLHIILNKDTIHLKQDMARDDGSHPVTMSPYDPPTPVYYFASDQVNFGLFANNNYELFIFKEKIFPTIKLADASKHIGKIVKINCEVYTTTDDDKTLVIDKDANTPGKALTLMLTGESRKSLLKEMRIRRELNKQIKQALDTSITAAGKIVIYQSRLHMVVRQPTDVYLGADLELQKP